MRKKIHFAVCIAFIFLLLCNTGLAQTFTEKDLQGTWDFHMLTSGDAPQWVGWVYGVVSTDGNGNYTWISIKKSDGDSTLPGQGTMNITVDGVVTVSGTDFHAVMNAQKDMIVGVMTDGGGGYNFMVYSKQNGGIYNTADLQGTWDFHALISGDAPKPIGWGYGVDIVDVDGNFTCLSITRNDGDSTPHPAGTMEISANGIVTFIGGDFHGIINAQKDMIVGVMTDGGGSYDLISFSKQGDTSTNGDNGDDGDSGSGGCFISSMME